LPTKLTDKDNVYISAEEVSKRGEFEKHYLLSDGSFVAVSYPEAVHYKNDDGKWEEVDNQLSYDSKTSRIVNGQNGFSVSFAEKPSGNSLASLLHDGIPFSWTLSAMKKLDSGKNTKLTAFSTSTATIVQAEKVSLASTVSRANIAETSIIGKKVTDADAFTNDKLSGKLGYASVFASAPEISVDYSVYHNKIEEDIYINSPTDLRSFSMEIQANGLTAIVNDDGSVDFVDADGTMQYRIGIPYMQDANHEVLNDIEVTATLNGNVWTVTYTPDEEWLTSEERAYPILLDPSVTTNEYYSNITDTYVYEGNTANHSSEQHMYIGVKSGKIHRAYVRLNYFPAIDYTSPILGATMQLSFASGTTTGKTAQVYKASSSWNPSTLTYSSQPTILADNLLSTCDYNSSIQSLAFDITDDISKLNIPALGEPNYGYVVKYADETNVNPDYNMFCSMEHTNVAKRPVITINYGYVLPSTLTNGGVYAFQNADTNYFLAVDGGEDANDVNVFTEAVDETYDSFVFLPQNLFKLEYIPSTGAYYLRAMCSSNGTNRVLDVVKYGGYPDYGSNVQIYTPTDSLAQHWLIIATGEDTFKIVIRNDTSLLLTENTDYENVELMFEIDEDEYCQEWRIYNTAGQMIRTPYITSIEDGIYYFNNRYHGKYLHNGNGTPNTASGLIEDLEDTVRWNVTHVGNNTYTIQSMDDMTKYLYADLTSFVSLSTPSTLTSRYLWRFLVSPDTGDMLIQNVGTQYYLKQILSTSLAMVSSLGTAGTQTYNECVWRIASQSYYAGKELTSFTIDDVIIDVGGSKTPTINKAPSNALWSSASDFIYSYLNGTSDNLSFNEITGNVSGSKIGISEYRATHKVTGLTYTVKIYVDRYTYELDNFFGFDSNVSLLIRDLYNRIDNVFSSETATQRAWRASRLLSEFTYDEFYWNDVAGYITTDDNRESYFTETLGYTESEYFMINSALTSQHEDAVINDFTHMQAALSGRLAYTLGEDYFLSNWGISLYTGNYGYYTNEEISYFAGWLGDAVLILDNETTTSMDNADYVSDLDAENVYRIILQGHSSVEAFSNYYSSLSSSNNRAHVFTQYILFEYVRYKVFYELIDAEFYRQIDLALERGDIITAEVYQDFINDEDYHWAVLENQYEDTYNFLNSLRDCRSTMGDY
ncbi:MAG: RICIN domain-containing protein, partial [Clostridia bacterium]|nr:RICIN domain-containing protein [Clostridia bacterium]